MPRRLTPPREAIWRPLLVLSVVAALLFLVAPGSWQRGLRAFIDLAGAVSVAVAVRVRRPAYATPWWLLAAALWFAALGDTIALYYDHVAQEAPPFPSLVDAAYLMVAPLMALAVYLLARRRTPGREVGKLLDAAVVSTGAAMVGSVFVMTPSLAGNMDFGPLQQTVATTFPAFDTLVLVLLTLLLRAGRNAALSLLRAGVLVLLATDVAYLVASIDQTYAIGSPIDAGWLLTSALVAAAAWHPSVREVAEPIPDTGSDRIGHPRVLLLALAALTIPAVLVQTARSGPDAVNVASVAASCTLLLGLAFTRLYLLTDEVASLRAAHGLSARQTQFATMAAHELRTPITTLRGSLSTLQRAASAGLAGVHLDELVAMAVRQTDRLERLCADLDIVVQSDAGGPAIAVEPVDVGVIAREVVAGIDSAVAYTTIEVPDGLVAEADAVRLAQVLDNLVRNAVQHAPGSTVRVTAGQDGDHVLIEVADDGPGLRPDIARVAFERFALRGADATGGFGIGLWIVRELVGAMDGAVSYDGPPGGGSVFRVRLPAGRRLAFSG